MSFQNEIIIPKTIDDYTVSRTQVVGMMSDYYRAAGIAEREMEQLTSYGLPYGAMPKTPLDEAIKQLDKTFWRIAFEQTGFMQLFDAASREKFDLEIKNNPPEFNMANVRSTFLEISQKADTMFAEGIVNVFRKLSGKYQSNDVFKIGDKVIMTGSIQPKWCGGGKEFRHGYAADEINDVDRVFKTLDGKKHIPRELSSAMNKAFMTNETYDDEYFHAKAFKNSNLHLTFKRADLLEKANMIIAQWYGGNVISKGRR